MHLFVTAIAFKEPFREESILWHAGGRAPFFDEPPRGNAGEVALPHANKSVGTHMHTDTRVM